MISLRWHIPLCYVITIFSREWKCRTSIDSYRLSINKTYILFYGCHKTNLKRPIRGVISLEDLLGVTITMTITEGIGAKDSEVEIWDPPAIHYDVLTVRRTAVGVFTRYQVILHSIGVIIAILRNNRIGVGTIVAIVRIVIYVSYSDGIPRMARIWVSMLVFCKCRLLIIGGNASIRRIWEYKLGSVLVE